MTSPTLTPTRSTTDVQRAVVDAADALYAEHGIASVSTADVARRAGLDSAVVTAAYPTQHDLAVAVL
ncbi:MAG: TetR family transcriptional regulator, partial [Curtobacterium sp.]